jgi:hypothetical protein
MTVEAYSDAERAGAGPHFYPDTAAKRDSVVANNVHGALAVIATCFADYLNLKFKLPGISFDIFSFTFETRPGVVYQVEYKDSLSNQSWSLLQSIQGDGQEMTVRDQIVPQRGMRFYRVRVQ